MFIFHHLSVKWEEGVRLPPSSLAFGRIMTALAGQLSRRIHVRGDEAYGVASTNAFLRMWRVIHHGSLFEPGYSVCLASS